MTQDRSPFLLLLPRAPLWAMPRKSSLWLLCQNIWDMCQPRCEATAETPAKVPATTVVAFVCMLLPLSHSLSFRCHKPELIWLSFRVINNNSNCIFILKSKSLSRWLYRAFFGAFCFISWRSTDTALSCGGQQSWFVAIHEFQANVQPFNDEELCCYWRESRSGVQTHLFLNNI